MKIIRNESLDNLKRVVDSKTDVDVHAGITLGMKDALDYNATVNKHLDAVNKDLDDKAKAVITDSPDTGKKVDNAYTKQLKLDESIEDFNINSVR